MRCLPSAHPLTIARPNRGFPNNHRLPPALRFDAHHEHASTAGGELHRDEQTSVVEAILLLADEPLNTRRIAQAAGIDSGQARKILRRLQALYVQGDTPYQIEEIAGGFQLLTRPTYHPWLAKMRRQGHDLRLTPAARETLAIVAYRQPIMRADVEAIRGVQSGEILRQLMEKGLVRIAGRHESLGRPVLYGTTRKFLQWFGLKSLEDLPLADQIQ